MTKRALTFLLQIAFIVTECFAATTISTSKPLAANFSVADGGTRENFIAYDFNDGFQGWSPEDSADVRWIVQNLEEAGPGKGFSYIDPDDTSSLFLDSPFSSLRKGKAQITSPEIELPVAPTLNFYVGFSSDYDDVCRLILAVSTDDFRTSEDIWNSGAETGSKTWRWHPVSVPLADYEERGVKFRFRYTSGSSDRDDSGGYLGDFAIDNFVITTMKTIDHIDIKSGESVRLQDYSEGEITEWLWELHGAEPSFSTEQNPVVTWLADGKYDVTLTVFDRKRKSATRTKQGFVSVTGHTPLVSIIPPNGYRIAEYRKPLVAPLTPVVFTAEASGAPTLYTWTFTGAGTEPYESTTFREASPTVQFQYLHDQKATLVAQNQHGVAMDELEFTVEFEGGITNLLPSDAGCTQSLGDNGVFPGSNNIGISAFAEKFSKPSVPVRINAVKVHFSNVRAAEQIDRLTNIGVHIYTSREDKPYSAKASAWKAVGNITDTEFNGKDGGTLFEFDEPPFIEEEFFIVIDGLPAYKDTEAGTTCVGIGMAEPREQGGTAFIRKDNDWINASEHFEGDRQTSFMIFPLIAHSIMIPVSEQELNVTGKAGTAEVEFFSYLGWTRAVADTDWLRAISRPGETTVQTLEIGYDALPLGVTEREGHIEVTDGASALTFTILQKGESGIEHQGVSEMKTPLKIYTLTGYPVIDTANPEEFCPSQLASGIYIIRRGETVEKIIVR